MYSVYMWHILIDLLIFNNLAVEESHAVLTATYFMVIMLMPILNLKCLSYTFECTVHTHKSFDYYYEI